MYRGIYPLFLSHYRQILSLLFIRGMKIVCDVSLSGVYLFVFEYFTKNTLMIASEFVTVNIYLTYFELPESVYVVLLHLNIFLQIRSINPFVERFTDFPVDCSQHGRHICP